MTFTFHFHALEKEMATHSSVLAWRIPGMGEPGGLPSMVSHSRTRLKRLSSSSSNNQSHGGTVFTGAVVQNCKTLPVFCHCLGLRVTVTSLTQLLTLLSDHRSPDPHIFFFFFFSFVMLTSSVLTLGFLHSNMVNYGTEAIGCLFIRSRNI